MLVAIIATIICISIASVITQKFKFKQESSVLITVLSIAIFLYIAGLFNLMKYAVYFIYFVSIVSIIYTIYSLIKRNIKITEIITPGILFYIFTVLFMVIVVKDTNYYEWDEFSHWGANLKAMVQHDLFWSNNIYDGVHVVYTPLAGLIEYFFCKLNGGFAEDISYIAINFFIITLLLPICKNEKYNFRGILKLLIFWIIVYVSIKLCNFQLTSIYIDLLLGILFTTGMYLAFKLDGKEDKINLFLIMISMPLLKDTGLLLLGIILMQLFFNKILLRVIEDKKVTKENFKNFGIIVLVLIIALGLYGTWKIYCGANDRYLDDRHDKNAISQIEIKQYLKAVMLINTDNPKYIDIARSFYDNLNIGAIVGSLKSTVTTIKLFAILNIMGFVIYVFNQDKQEKKRILTFILSFNIGFVLYCLLLLATFMFAFTETEGRALASYSRYITTYFIAWIIGGASIALNSKNRYQIISALVVIALCIYPTSALSILDISSRKGVTGITPEIAWEASIIKSKVNLDDKVYLVYQNNGGGYDYHKLRYSISPIVTNLMYEWSLGPKYYEADIWSYDISKEEFEKKLIDEEFNYVFIAQVDEQFIKIYGELIEGNYNIQNFESLNNKLLKVNKLSENRVILSIVE